MTPEQLNKLKKIKAFQLIPTTHSKDIEWINWMKALDKDFDRDTATSIFINLWDKRGNSNARTLQLRDFMKDKYNVSLSEGAIDKVVDLGGGVIDTVSGIFKVGKITFLVIGGIVIVATLGLVYSLIKNPSSAASFMPYGRGIKIIK